MWGSASGSRSRLEMKTLTLLTLASIASSDLTCVLHAHLCRKWQRNWGFVGAEDIYFIIEYNTGSICTSRCRRNVVGTNPQLHLNP
jgi:hypothetical protein